MLHARYERAPLPPARADTPSPGTAAPASAPVAGKGAPGGGGRQRDPFFDNAKYLAIVLVAVGHAWEPMRSDSRALEAMYFVVYAFHMPAFIVISGYLSRTFTGKPRQIQRLVTGVAVPYVVFETVYTLFMRWADNPDREFSYQEPGFALWFLVALFVWRLTTPLWTALRWPLPVALTVGLLASVTPSVSDDFGLMRVLQYLPFFVLGLLLRPEHFRTVKNRSLRLAAVPVTLATLVFAYWAVPHMSKGWFLHDKAAQDLGVPAWMGATMYLALFGCSLVLTACFLSWVPRRTMWFTALGSGTLYAYLLHVYPIKAAREFGWYEAAWVGHPLGQAAITVAAAAAMTALCTRPVQRAFRFATEPRMPWFFRPDPVERAQARERRHDGRSPEGERPVREREPVSPGR